MGLPAAKASNVIHMSLERTTNSNIKKTWSKHVGFRKGLRTHIRYDSFIIELSKWKVMKTAFSLQARLFGEAERLCLETLLLHTIVRMTLGCKETLGRLGHYHKWPSCVVEGFVQLREHLLRVNQVWSFSVFSFLHALSCFSAVVWSCHAINLPILCLLCAWNPVVASSLRKPGDPQRGRPQQKNAISRALGSLGRFGHQRLDLGDRGEDEDKGFSLNVFVQVADQFRASWFPKI